MKTDTPVVHHLKDYKALEFTVDSVNLEFVLEPTATVVTNTMQLSCLTELNESNGDLNKVKTLVLDGENLELLAVSLNGGDILLNCTKTDENLEVSLAGLSAQQLSQFELQITTQIAPQKNTALEGLYRTSGNYCTQCEAEGFRKITYFFDRPDVLSVFTTKIVADKADNAVLLSNGNLIEAGELEGNKHYAVWHDPFKKPCYLFALVAGNLEFVQDSYKTLDGRDVDLRIYVEPKNIDKCDHAMESLKKSMQWDEQRFGLIYDLDIYMIVAVDDFNMGAMENKGLNVFNSKFVLAKPETATDVDYEGIEAVIGHEYFHNWTGNRVTCRDWFQLTLKEGLTVFRDQEFTADMLSPAVKRIEDVKRLRSNQFPEDAGPMSHPIQPQSYIEMNNFYTMTVYEKGAEVVRMYHTLLGEQDFRKGMDLYFKRHDGQAVTVESFRDAMADANGVNLSQMHNWYVQNGTPVLAVSSAYDPQTKVFSLDLTQKLPKTDDEFDAFLMPVKMALFTQQGEAIELSSSTPGVEVLEHEALIKFTDKTARFEFTSVPSEPVVSLLRGFSAPVIMEFEQADNELSVLVQHDSDSFVRWESMQSLAMHEIKRNIKRYEANQDLQLSNAYEQAFAGVLNDTQIDKSLKALTLALPDLTYIGEQYKTMNVDAIYHVHQWLKITLATKFETQLLAQYSGLVNDKAYAYNSHDIAERNLKNICLQYLANLEVHIPLVQKQYELGTNMTDVLAALTALVHTDTPARAKCLDDFYSKWKNDTLVLDKWFALQAGSHHINALAHVKALVKHKDFIITNPNRVRSVLGVFGRLNMLGFHNASGEGYAFLAEQVQALDKINPQVAARMVAPFTHWHKLDEKRQAKMLGALKQIVATEGLSKDVYEIASKSLA